MNSPTNTFLVIADELNHRAVRYDVGTTPANPFVLEDPSTKVDTLSFVRPHGVFFNNDAGSQPVFYVTDTARGVLNQYDFNAVNFENQIGTPGTTGEKLFFPGSGEGQVPGNLDSVPFANTRNSLLMAEEDIDVDVLTGTSPGSADGQLYWPESVTGATDGTTYVIVANTYNNRVEVYSELTGNLTFEQNIGSP